MRVFRHLARLSALVGITGLLLLAQHGGGGHSAGIGGGRSAGIGGGAHSAGIGSRSAGIASRPNSAGIGPSPIAPFHMPQTIGAGFGPSTPAYGGRYPSFSPSSNGSRGGRRGGGYNGGGYNNAGYKKGPWRSNSRYGRSAYGLPYFGYYPYSSYLGTPFYNDYNSFDDYDASGGATVASPETSQLSDQVAQLNDQINDLRGRLEQTQSSPAPPVNDDPPAPQAPAPPVSVVLRDGRTLQVHDYAVTGDTFWDLSSQPARKIPLANIDVPASAKASEAGGAEFPKVPSSR